MYSSRRNLVADHAFGLGAQGRLRLLRQVGRHRLERRVVGVVGDRRRVDDARHRRITTLQRDPRQREAALQAGAHVVGVFAEITRDVSQLRQVVAILPLGMEVRIRGVRLVAPERRVAAERALVDLEPLVADQRLDLISVDRVILRMLRAQRGGGNGR
jgi:hypothetical protein